MINRVPIGEIVTIDGPAGAGKSTIARGLARRLTEETGESFEYLDTGSMYRALTLFGMRKHIDWTNRSELEAISGVISLSIQQGETFLDGENVTELVRKPEVTALTRHAADNVVIRRKMVDMQRQVASEIIQKGGSVVTEGRDQGTVAFPKAICKFYLTATPEERARRRLGELQSRGLSGEIETILREIKNRDDQDEARVEGPLCVPPDAQTICSDGKTIDEVVAQMTRVVLSQLSVV
ncbi:MAG: (d)CMP kinase [Thermoguttaceae bacterium]